MANVMILTPEGRQKLVDELKWREGERHDEIVEAIREARAQGDLSENESRINEIRHILATARVAEDSNDLEVSIGCTVELEDAKGKKTSFTIVGTTETDSLAHKISNESPAGATLIGRATGDKVSFSTPSGKVREYTITSIRRQ